MSQRSVFPGWHEPTALKWVRNRTGERSLAAIQDGTMERWSRIYESSLERLRVIVAWEVGHGWHLSISHPSRYPTWDEIRDARYDLVPDGCTLAMLLPPRGGAAWWRLSTAADSTGVKATTRAASCRTPTSQRRPVNCSPTDSR